MRFSLLPLTFAATTFLVTACAGLPAAPPWGSRVDGAPVRAEAARQGVVRAIEIVDGPASSRGGGAVVGGLVGGLLGNQIGSGGGRAAATIAGAVGGAFLGDHLEQRRQGAGAGHVYRVLVQFDTGATQSFSFRELDGLRVGDRVQYWNGMLGRG